MHKYVSTRTHLRTFTYATLHTHSHLSHTSSPSSLSLSLPLFLSLFLSPSLSHTLSPSLSLFLSPSLLPSLSLSVDYLSSSDSLEEGEGRGEEKEGDDEVSERERLERRLRERESEEERKRRREREKKEVRRVREMKWSECMDKLIQRNPTNDWTGWGFGNFGKIFYGYFWGMFFYIWNNIPIFPQLYYLFECFFSLIFSSYTFLLSLSFSLSHSLSPPPPFLSPKKIKKIKVNVIKSNQNHNINQLTVIK